MGQILKETLFNWVNIIIILGALAVIIRLVKNNKDFGKILKDLNNALNDTTSETKVNQENHSLETLTSRQLVSRNLDAVKNDYEKAGIVYHTCVSLISVFPLMGLFGTVIGLMPGLAAMNSDAGLEMLYSSLSTALSSTFWGLVAAIVLKLIDSVWVSKTISKLENKIADSDREFKSYFGEE